jgi:hypothetical protein
VQLLIAKMPFVLRVYLCFQILEASLLVKPAGEDSHSALCVALVDAIVRDEPLLAPTSPQCRATRRRSRSRRRAGV